ncbi:MAG TPA: hypothetical protein VI959_03515 [Alphaproteobacteria bacterium]|nr:hypothetical protein [Alphaproteobacteria bacterium]
MNKIVFVFVCLISSIMASGNDEGEEGLHQKRTSKRFSLKLVSPFSRDKIEPSNSQQDHTQKNVVEKKRNSKRLSIHLGVLNSLDDTFETHVPQDKLTIAHFLLINQPMKAEEYIKAKEESKRQSLRSLANHLKDIKNFGDFLEDILEEDTLLQTPKSPQEN